MTAPAIFLFGVAAILYGPSLYVRARNWWRAANAEVDDLLRPLPQRTPRLAGEWARITEFQMRARADIAANADLSEWEKEMQG